MEQVRCSRCNRRLFDISEDFHGTIAVKCPKCKTVIVIKRDSDPTSHAPVERNS